MEPKPMERAPIYTRPPDTTTIRNRSRSNLPSQSQSQSPPDAPDTQSLGRVSPPPPEIVLPSPRVNQLRNHNHNQNAVPAQLQQYQSHNLMNLGPPSGVIGSASAPQANEKVAPSRKRLFSGNAAQQLKVTSLTDFLRIELTRGYRVELEEERFTARREKVYTFITIPKELERFMSYGFFQCLDAFLYLFTFLPIRCVLAIISFLHSSIPFTKLSANSTFSMRLQSNEKCDLLKLLILSVCVFGFSFFDTSVMYHVIKSQSVIKLYMFFNMLEVCDRLFASFVQDTLDALFFTAVEKVPDNAKNQRAFSLTTHLLLAIFSVAGHAVVLLFQGTTLNVAINSSNRALLTVMMSNNFVELKGAVFKKFDKLNLFQVSCSDVRERFHLCVLLFIVCIQTMREYQWEESRFWILLPDCVMVLLAEVGVDWIKHAFITRFNEISPEVYREYTLSLAFDLAQTKNRRAFSDSSDMVGRRLGFVPLPLAVLLVKVMRPTLKSLNFGTVILFILGYFAVSTFRLLNSLVLLGKACSLIDQHHGIKKSDESSPVEEEFERERDHRDRTHQDMARIFRSHPTTRTPSPNRLGPSTYSDEGDDSPVKVKGQSFSASQSVSTSPRASIAMPGEDTSQLIIANSDVSILSMNLNEELLKAQKTPKSQPASAEKKLHKRKYSLGNEFKFETVEELDSTLIPSSSTSSPTPPDDKEPDPEPDSELEKLLGRDEDEESKENSAPIAAAVSESTQNDVHAQSQAAQATGARTDEKRVSESDDHEQEPDDGTTPKTPKKRKGLSWLLHH